MDDKLSPAQKEALRNSTIRMLRNAVDIRTPNALQEFENGHPIVDATDAGPADLAAFVRTHDLESRIEPGRLKGELILSIEGFPLPIYIVFPKAS